ncbi:MAG: extracellular solute-binding protein [Candidatus Marinimicrobia bacterium]|nr:extracellular solute-binding protein [Candidatus Neomarinimicrobiota bacterium]MCF7839802.1 extracellular solute-binding protein [Candidatus Neomarinimicrobiota bacterium]MCF7901836.1 extracellular solute-binding protein [Candidatus Neomarinimicrobiota bacterium]
MMRKFLVLGIITGLVFMVSCGGGGTKHKPLALAIKTAESVTPPDTVTSAEEGGYGFDKVAEDLGFTTYKIPQDELQYFGDPRAVKGGVLTTIVSRFPATMRTEGQNANYVENSTLAGLLYEGLVDLHPVTLEFIPRLASHWKISDDKMKFWFRIDPDARWSDGMPVTAQDVVTTWDLHMDETILSPSDQLVYGKFERPVVESKYIVSVVCKQLSWRNFLYFGASMSILPHHILKDLTGSEYLKDYQYKIMPGTGAYTMQESDIKNQISYSVTRRLDYWAKDKPENKYTGNFDKIKFVVVKDNPSLEFEKFKKGEQDFYTVNMARMWVEDTEFDAVKQGWVQKRKIYSDKPAGTGGFAFNLRKWPFNDRRIRYAFAYLLPREKMNEEMYYNEYLMQNSLYSGSTYANPNNEDVKFNPEKAQKLLAEAGWSKRNQDGWLVNDEGQVFRLEIGIPKSVEYMVTPYQQTLKDYGIDLQIKFVDGNTLWKQLMERDFTIYMQSWGGLVFPNPETSLKSELADETYTNNISGIKNEEIDRLCDQYDVTFSQEERVKIVRKIDSIYSDIHPAAWTTYRPYQRLLYWDKFGYPDYMFSRFTGDYRSIYSLWWIDPDKEAALKEAMAAGKSLPQGELEVKYWKELISKTDKFNW